MAKKKSARQYVFEGMEILPEALIPFVEKQLESEIGHDWREQVAERYRLLFDEDLRFFKNRRFYRNRRTGWDQAVLLKVMDGVCPDAFNAVLGCVEQEIVKELIQIRNKLSHNENFSYDAADHALASMCRLAEAVGAGESAEKLGVMHRAISCGLGATFNGFQFSDGTFDYDLGKNVLLLAMDELRERADLRREIGIDRQDRGKRSVTRSDRGSVWDVLVFAAAGGWKAFPHLTLGIGNEYVSAMVTLPNKASEAQRRFKKLDEKDFCRMMQAVLKEMSPILSVCRDMEPRLRVQQRRWTPSLARLRPPIDVYIDIDLRTLDGDRRSSVSRQPQWIDAAFEVLRRRRPSRPNLELQIGARFPYTCPAITGPEALDRVAQAWIACKPYIDALFGRKNAAA